MIVISDLTKRYGARAVISGVSLSVAPGEVVALAGPNGAGKSTILKAVAGIVRPSAGTVLVNGYDVVADPVPARAALGYVPQRLAFADHVCCRDVCRLVLALRGLPDDTSTLLSQAGLAAAADTRVRDLSGGQRQRLSLALALAGAPRALVLDEPSISLDAEGAVAVCRAIASARARAAAVLLASHHLHEVAAVADRVVVIQSGRVVAESQAGALRQPDQLRAFYSAAVAAREEPHAA